MANFGMTRRQGTNLTKRFQVIYGEFVAHEMECNVLKGATAIKSGNDAQKTFVCEKHLRVAKDRER